MDTAYFYRRKYSPICFDTALSRDWVEEDGTLLDEYVNPQDGLLLRPRRIAEAAWAELQARQEALNGAIGPEQASISYANYQQPPQADWQRAYFGDNVARLAAINAAYDPLGQFSKPLIVGYSDAGSSDSGGSMDSGNGQGALSPAPKSAGSRPLCKFTVFWAIVALLMMFTS
jgi:hypothetical protein